MQLKNIFLLVILLSLISFCSSYSLMQNGSFETGTISNANSDLTTSKWWVYGYGSEANQALHNETQYIHAPPVDANSGTKFLRGEGYKGSPSLGECTFAIADNNKFTGGKIRLSAKTINADCGDYIAIGHYWDGTDIYLACDWGTGGIGSAHTLLCPLQIATLTTSWKQYDFNYCGTDQNLIIYVGHSTFAGDCNINTYGNTFIDNIQYQQTTTLTNSITEPTEPVERNTDFNILVKVYDTDSAEITDATVRLNWNLTGYQTISYNATIGYYVYQRTSGATVGDWNYSVLSSRTGDINGYSEGIITIRTNLTNYLTITNISNISHSINSYNVNLIPNTQDETFSFSATNTDSYSLAVDYNIFNSLDDGRQYFIYTSGVDGNYAFDDTLTYGGTYPIQKIWDNATSRYIYSFTDTLGTGEVKYYKLTYKMPDRYYKGANSDTFNQLPPSPTTIEGMKTDIYSISSYSNMRNYLKEFLPAIDQAGYKNYEYQFTAWGSSALTLKVGTIRNSDYSTITNIENIAITTTKKRYSVSVSAVNIDDQIILYTDETSAKQLYVYDYALISRGYFSKRLELKTIAGSPLPLLNYGTFYPYVTEGKSFRAVSEAYDREGDLNKLEVEVYLNIVADANKVKKYVYELTSETENNLALNYIIDQIIDEAGNGDKFRDLRVKFTLFDNNNISVSTQSKWVRFVQFPYFKEDLTIYASETKQKSGESPEGQVYIETIAPENLLGVKIKVWTDSNSYAYPSYETTIYKNAFTCELGYCQYDYKLNEFAFTSGFKLYHFSYTALLTTEYESLAQDSNKVLYYLDVYVNLKQFTTSRIFQMRERTDNPSQYRSTEKIPVVLELRDEELRNLKNEMDITMYIQLCTAQTGGVCVQQAKAYYPDSFIYDEKTGYNYFIFNKYWTTQTGALLPDGNYIRFIGVLGLVETDYNMQNDYNPYLTKKCKTAHYTTNFYANALGGVLGWGYNALSDILAPPCDVGYYPDELVTTTLNTASEDRIQINNSYSPTAPTQEAFICVNADENNITQNSLRQEILCITWGTLGEQQIDKLNFTVTNNYSDLSIKDYPQYLSLDIPYDLLIYQQPALLQAMLKQTTKTKVTTTGEAIQEWLNNVLAGTGNTVISVVDETNLRNAITNIGFDANFSKPFSPTNLGFILLYKIEGLKVVNIQDYLDPQNVKAPKQFIRYAKENNLYLPTDNATTITVYGSDMQELLKTQQNGYLVINEEEQKSVIKIKDPDSNITTQQTAPTTLSFNFINTMYYDNSMGSIRRYVPINLKTIIKRGFRWDDITKGVQEFIKDPAGSFIGFMYSNILIITILLLIIISVSVIYSNFQRR